MSRSLRVEFAGVLSFVTSRLEHQEVFYKTNNLHRQEDLAMRYGGEKFVIILPHTNTAGVKHWLNGSWWLWVKPPFPTSILKYATMLLSVLAWQVWCLPRIRVMKC